MEEIPFISLTYLLKIYICKIRVLTWIQVYLFSKIAEKVLHCFRNFLFFSQNCIIFYWCNFSWDLSFIAEIRFNGLADSVIVCYVFNIEVFEIVFEVFVTKKKIFEKINKIIECYFRNEYSNIFSHIIYRYLNWLIYLFMYLLGWLFICFFSIHLFIYLFILACRL